MVEAARFCGSGAYRGNRDWNILPIFRPAISGDDDLGKRFLIIMSRWLKSRRFTCCGRPDVEHYRPAIVPYNSNPRAAQQSSKCFRHWHLTVNALGFPILRSFLPYEDLHTCLSAEFENCDRCKIRAEIKSSCGCARRCVRNFCQGSRYEKNAADRPHRAYFDPHRLGISW
jgi:hypothetical protein